MRKISVKFIITFWFTMLMVAVAVLVMVFMLTASRLTMEQDMQRRIVDGVRDNRNDVRYEDDTIHAEASATM